MMHTVEILDEALALAAQCGIRIRQDWFGGMAAGACQLKGQSWIFLDLSLSPREQLEQVLSALREVPCPAEANPSPKLQSLLQLRQAA